MKLFESLRQKGAELWSWFRAISRRRQLESEMESELLLHLEALTADLERAGHSPAEAVRRARIALGPALVHKEEMRASLGLRWFDELRADVRYGFRILAKSPSFTLIAASSLAFAIGANTTIFAIGKQLLYDRLSVPHPEQLRMLRWNGDGHEVVDGMWGDFDSIPGSGTTSSVFTYPIYQQLRDHNEKLQDLIAFKEEGMNATVRGNAQRVNAAMVSGNFYSALEVRPQLGRSLQPSDDAVPGSGFVAVISDGLWLNQYGRSPSVIGQTVTLNQSVVTIVGVNPQGFTGAKNVQQAPDLFVPISLQPVIDPKGKTSLLTDQNLWWVNIVGRTKPGVKDSEAQAALDVQLQAAVRATIPVPAGGTIPRLALVDGSRGLHYADGMFRKPLFVLSGFTAFVVLLACANIANLLLARGAQRQREMSVRLAMGAGRSRILRQLLTESLMLAALGGAGGLLVGYIGRSTLPKLMTNAWERGDGTSFNAPFDWGVFAFTVAVTLITGIVFGLAPAWLAARVEVSSSLKETSKSASRRRKGLTGKSIVAFQVALSTLLVVGAGLFLRTLLQLNSVDVGFKADNLVLFEINPPARRYPGPKDVQLHQQLEQRFAALPGVERVAPGSLAYISQSMGNTDFLPEGEPANPQQKRAEFENSVGIDFFSTLGIPIIAGRGFAPQDTSTSPKVGIINRSLARKRFPNSNPIGKRFKADKKDSDWIQIVGICADTQYSDLRSAPPPQFFLPYVQQDDAGTLVYQVRTRMQPAALFPALRSAVQSVDRDLPIIDYRTQREQINATMQIERTFAALTAGFGVMALALACVGIYGIMAYSVAQRTNEIGIRLALGAQPFQVRSMILRESSWLTLVGIVFGVLAALGLTRLVKSMLYGVTPNDPVTLLGGMGLLLGVAFLAAWIPARRAASVQPMEALRHE
ncbi:ABC transporter permease [Telmatobacter sp. DSM 110680]|uniref:ABC transporter permease n=1 Tax=Telmatobacter sp. DSM 110680 TaxID=3036704 RepID=A0AAU7DPE1_9BACT